MDNKEQKTPINFVYSKDTHILLTPQEYEDNYYKK